MDRLRRDTLLGLVFFGTLAVLLWATINLTDLSIDNVRIKVAFPQAGGCEVGTNVMVLGKKQGKVGEIDVDYDDLERPVTLTLLLRDEVPLREDYVIMVRDSGLLGAKQVYIDPGKKGAKLAPRDLWLGVVEPGAMEAIGNIAKGEGRLGAAVYDAVAEFGKFGRNLNDPDTSIGRLTNSRELHDSILAASDRLGTILQAVIDQKGAVGDLLMNEETKNNVHGFVADLRTIGTRLTSLDSPLGVLLNDKDAAMNVQAILANVDTLIADAEKGRGIVGKLLRDDDLAARFGNVVGNLDQLLANLTNPDAGLFGALTSDPATASDVKVLLANLRHVSDQLAARRGLLGMLINDEDLGTRFRRIMVQVSRALEDAREAAPIANLIQVVLGAF
jgi:phospholipid/cholesterol/gamma-HCH transport system substrate-binding protein